MGLDRNEVIRYTVNKTTKKIVEENIVLVLLTSSFTFKQQDRNTLIANDPQTMIKVFKTCKTK